jgi:hypothetical protein
MIKFTCKIFLFFVIVGLLDMCYGFFCKSLTSKAKGGTTYHYYYSAKVTNEDVILMGSSRMCRHYNPSIISDSLSMTVYNTGVKGNGIILNYGILNLILERYSPKLIVYDVFSFDMYNDERFADDDARYLDNLKDYYDNDEIKDIFAKVNPMETLKMYSMLYRYNSKLIRLVGDCLYPTEKYDRGYNPYYGSMDYVPDLDDGRNNQLDVDTLKLYYVRKFIEKAQGQGVPVVISASPRYGVSPVNHYNDPIKRICKEYNVPFLDYYADDEIVNKKEYFHDANHLNNIGADVFSTLFVSDLKKNLGNEN